jgi:hypothetical protein
MLARYGMRFWFSNLPLPAAGLALLSDAGLQPWHASDPPFEASDCLLLYNCPDLAIGAARGPDHPLLTADQLIKAYENLLLCSEQTGQPLLAIWQLQQLAPDGLRIWLANTEQPEVAPGAMAFHPVCAPAIIAAATLSLIEAEPELLDAYNDLELRAALLGREPDLFYRSRLLRGIEPGALLQGMVEILQAPAIAADLQQQLDANSQELQALQQAHQAQQIAHQAELQALREQFEPQLVDLQQQLLSSTSELSEAREEAELTLRQLHQVQEELETLFLADRDKQQQLDANSQELQALQQAHQAQQIAHQAELQALREQFEPQLVDLQQKLLSSTSELSEAREEAELTLLQLHQVQEELEHYFLLSRGQDHLLTQYGEQQLRVQKLLARTVLPTQQAPADVAPKP